MPKTRLQPPQNHVRGIITTQNLVPAGVATPNSAVEIDVDDAATIGIQVSGVYTGALSLQATIDGTNWVTLGGATLLTNANAGTAAATIASAATGIFWADVATYSKVRVTGLAAMTGNASITLQTGADDRG